MTAQPVRSHPHLLTRSCASPPARRAS